MTPSSGALVRNCLVTVGATVGFEGLTKATLDPAFWQYLKSQGFTSLRIQCGPDITWASDDLAAHKDDIPPGLTVDVFESSKNLMKEDMTLCKAAEERRALGMIISHAGTGTILDAWKLGIPIIVVPNTQLLNDHQTELARHLGMEGYAIQSTTRLEHLEEAIRKAELLQEENKTRWPPNPPVRQEKSPISLWSIKPGEMRKEEAAQMTVD